MLAGAAALVTSTQASAAAVTLFEYAFNIDGQVANITQGDVVPLGANLAAFDTSTGIGKITLSLSGSGTHSVSLFLDHDIDEAINTSFNESGRATGTPAAGQSWEIDEPGIVFGDIYNNFKLGALDDSNALPAGAEDDVSMAMGWSFVLGAGQQAVIDFSVSPNAPSGGFYLSQVDADSNASLHMWSGLTILDQDQNVPEPASWMLVAPALAGLMVLRRRTPAALAATRASHPLRP
jgi:hypothetical protein